MEFLLIGFIVVGIIVYRQNKGETPYKYVVGRINLFYDKYAPYSFKIIREKVKSLGQEYTPRQYTTQIIIFSLAAFTISYLYFYNIMVCILYVVLAIITIPYLTYLRCKKVYSEFIFEQIQVYTTNTIMEFATTKSFVKSLEGVYASGVLEEPVLSDVKYMIDLAYQNGAIDESLTYMNNKYDYYVVKNMHQLFLQITKEGAHQAMDSLDSMLVDIDALVEGVYRDRVDRQSFHKSFVQYGVLLYLLVMLVQYLLGVDTYLKLINQVLVQVFLHIIIISNTYFLLDGERYYNENVGAE